MTGHAYLAVAVGIKMAVTLAVYMPVSLVGDLAAAVGGMARGERATARYTVAARTGAAARKAAAVGSMAAAAGNTAAQGVEHEGVAGEVEVEEAAVLVKALPEIDPFPKHLRPPPSTTSGHLLSPL